MENTLNLLLQDKSLKWYTYINGRPVGPLSAREIVQRIQGGDLNFGSHVWKEGYQGWTRIYDVIDFKPLLPAEPAASLIQEFQKATQTAPPPLSPKQKEDLRTWFVYIDNADYGPISDVEVTSLIESGRIGPSTYMWQKGLADWMMASDIPIWTKEVNKGKAAQEAKRVAQKAASLPPERRGAPRRPFQAKVLLTDGKEVGWAVCRDISIGGLQLLMDHAPCDVGAHLRLNVNAHGSLTGFACEGTVVRILEDGRGFSFRFANLSNEAKQSIEAYIKA